MFTVLHPSYKLVYFRKKLNYTNAWINGARKLTRDAFDRNYASLVLDEDSDVGTGHPRNAATGGPGSRGSKRGSATGAGAGGVSESDSVSFVQNFIVCVFPFPTRNVATVI